jgi:hypothetical protein
VAGDAAFLVVVAQAQVGVRIAVGVSTKRFLRS